MEPRPRLCLVGALFAASLLVVPNVAAQQATLSGRVTDQQSGQPLVAVQVFIAGTEFGTLTQQDGRFLLENVSAGTFMLTAQLLGYATATQEVTAGADGPVEVDFALSQQALRLDEVIVTGTPGGTERRAIGNSVTSVRAAEVTQSVAVSDMQDLLSGRSPGLQFNRVGGNIGTGSEISIRGIGSFNLTREPIIMVDGVRVNNTASGGPTLGNDTERANTLNDFNPEDIESIEIIKGPAAATLYGTDASAGVIQIITKRGAQGDPEFTLAVRQGVNFIRDPEGRIGTKWTCKTNFAPPCIGSENGGGDDLVPYNAVVAANHALHDGTYNPYWSHDVWPQQNLFQYGPSQRYNVGVRGGTETTRYYLSTNYNRAEGSVYYNWQEAFSLRANIGVVFNENFSLDVSTGYIDGKTRLGAAAPGEGGEWDDMGWGNGYCTPIVNPSIVPGDPCSRTLGFQEHLPTDVANIEAIRENNRFTGSGTLNFTLGDWLSSRAIVGLDRGSDVNTSIHPIEVNQTSVYQRTEEGEIVVARPISTEVTLDWSATSEFNLGANMSTATSLGVQYYLSRVDELGNTGEGFASPLSRTINQTPSSRAQIDYEFIENKTLGFFVQEQLGWNDRLFLTAALRLDDNSAFGAELDPAAYPKLSGTWVVSEESFWNVNLINSLRLRGAWGQAGRQPSTFANTDTYGIIAGPGETSGIVPASTGNPEVGPERSTELELGVDYALLNDRIAGEFNWYTRKNEDALLSVSLPPSLGVGASIQQNIGRIDNWGWEASLSTRIYESPGLSVGLDFTATHTDNEIKELGDYPGSDDIRIGWQYPVQTETRYFVVDAEYDPEGWQQDAWGRRIASYCDQGVVVGGGDPNDRTGQYGVVRGGEVVPCNTVGDYPVSAGPAFYPYKFTVSPNVSLLNDALRIHMLIDGAYGKIGLDGQQEWGHRYNNSYDSRCECDPRWVAADRYGSMSTWGNYEADFWKLREVGVRYSLPASLITRIGADRAALSLSGRELATIWRANDGQLGLIRSDNPQLNVIDPETGNSDFGANNNHRTYPPLTSLNITLEVTF